MEKTLVDEFNTFVAIYEYEGRVWTRISGQIYLELKDFEWLGEVLNGLCERIRAGESLRGKHPKFNFNEQLEALTLQSPKPPSRQGTAGSMRRFDITQGGWVEE
jgi:hypothetical protein